MKKYSEVQTFINALCYALGCAIAWLWLTALGYTVNMYTVLALGGLLAMILITLSMMFIE